MLGSILGTGILGNAQQAYASGSGLANQSNAAQQQALYNQYAQGMFNQMAADHQHRYMINGRTMTWDEFLDELAPGDDNPMRTFLILKYKE